MARDSQGIPQKKMNLSSMHGSMTSKRSMPSASSRMGGKDEAAHSTSAGEPGAGEHYEIHPQEDGSAHVITPDGEKSEHPSMHHAAVHVMAHHGVGEHHMAVHHMPGGESSTTNHAGSDGAVQGPHDHSNLEALKDHMSKFLSEEEMEGGGGGEHEEMPAMSGGGAMY